MPDVEQGSDKADPGSEGKVNQADAGRLETQGGERINELPKAAKTIGECVEAYVAAKSIAKAAAAIGMNADNLRERLKKESRKRGMSSVRQLLGDDDDFGKGVTQSFLLNLIEEQEYRCRLSGIELTTDTASLDHLVPLSKGGTQDVDNVAWVHAEINRMKGQMSVDEFVAMCSKVVQWMR